jgi:hypothetical protein
VWLANKTATVLLFYSCVYSNQPAPLAYRTVSAWSVAPWDSPFGDPAALSVVTRLLPPSTSWVLANPWDRIIQQNISSVTDINFKIGIRFVSMSLFCDDSNDVAQFMRFQRRSIIRALYTRTGEAQRTLVVAAKNVAQNHTISAFQSQKTLS